MKLKSLMKKLNESDDFKDWQKKNKNSYLSHIFNMNDKINKDIWQIGDYNVDTDKMTNFVIDKEEIKVALNLEIFKKDNKINELVLKKVKIDIDKADKTARDFQKDNYPSEIAMMRILVLQNLEKVEQVYNITFVTHSLKILNIKIDANNGKAILHNLSSVTDFNFDKIKK